LTWAESTKSRVRISKLPFDCVGSGISRSRAFQVDIGLWASHCESVDGYGYVDRSEEPILDALLLYIYTGLGYVSYDL
jgi:hypothetical protein